MISTPSIFFTFRLMMATPSKMTAVPIQPEPTMPADCKSGKSAQPSNWAPNINIASPSPAPELTPSR